MMLIRHLLLILSVSSLAVSIPACAQEGDAAPAEAAAEAAEPAQADDGFADDKARVSYAIGMDIGNNLKAQGLDIDPSLLAEGVAAAIGEGEGRMNDEKVRQVLVAFQQRLMQKQMQERQEMAQKNQTAGEAFLAENKTAEGVKTTESGLQYKVIEEGAGDSPKPTDEVTVHYTGTLVDGTVFDSSRKRGQPATFQLGRVIPGWIEGLQLMKPGAKYKLFIPSDLAYGAQGMGQAIPPNSVLVFEVELLSVEAGMADNTIRLESAPAEGDPGAGD